MPDVSVSTVVGVFGTPISSRADTGEATDGAWVTPTSKGSLIYDYSRREFPAAGDTIKAVSVEQREKWRMTTFDTTFQNCSPSTGPLSFQSFMTVLNGSPLLQAMLASYPGLFATSDYPA
jgi:hypothetical protein